MRLFSYMRFNIIILWDHLRICGPSLTETSLRSAYLYNTGYETDTFSFQRGRPTKKTVTEMMTFETFLVLVSSHNGS